MDVIFRIRESRRLLRAWRSKPFRCCISRQRFETITRDINGSHIYIADGGHSENLGAFGLIRRLCENIIIVDAEQDEQFQFGAYFKLKEAVRAELGAVLKVPQIEAITGSCKDAFVGCKADEAWEKEPVAGERWRQAASNPVMTGTVGELPYCEKVSDASSFAHCLREREQKQLNVYYVKLAYLPAALLAAVRHENLGDVAPKRGNKAEVAVRKRVEEIMLFCSSTLSASQEKNRKPTQKSPERSRKKPVEESLDKHFCKSFLDQSRTVPFFGDRKTPFPQIQTTIQDFTEEQFKAYRNLGCLRGLALGQLLTNRLTARGHAKSVDSPCLK